MITLSLHNTPKLLTETVLSHVLPIRHMAAERKSVSYLIISACLVVIVGVIHGSLFQTLSRDPKAQSDFSVFYSAGYQVSYGEGGSLYDLQAQRTAQALATGKPGLNFISPPWVAILFAPLSMVGVQTAYLIWLVINLGLLGIIAISLHRIKPLFSDANLMYLSLFLFVPIHASLALGQLSLLVLLAYAGCLYQLGKGNDLSAGAILAIGMVKPHLILLMAVLLAFSLGRRFVVGLAAGMAALAGVTVLFLGTNVLLEYPQFLLAVQSVKRAGIYPGTMPNLHGLLAWLPGPGAAQNPLLAISSFGLAILAVWAWRSARTKEQTDFAYSLVIITTLLIAYHSNHADLSLAALPIYICLQHALWSPEKGEPRIVIGALAPFIFPVTYIALFLLLPLPLVVLPLLVFAAYLAARSGLGVPSFVQGRTSP